MMNNAYRILKSQAQQAAKSLDLETLDRILPELGHDLSKQAIYKTWFYACEKQDIQCLEYLRSRSLKSRAWEPSYASLATPALRLNKSQSLSWLLPQMQRADVLEALSAVLVSKKQIEHDISDSLLAIARHDPDLMQDFNLPNFRLGFIDFTANRKDPDILAEILQFVSKARLINYSGEIESKSVAEHWWSSWASSDKVSYDDLVFWDSQTTTHGQLSKDFHRNKTLLGYALAGGSVHSKKIVSKPAGSREFQAMEKSFETGQGMYLAAMIYNEPAALASALSKNPRFAQLALEATENNGNNFLHLLAKYRCLPKNSHSKKCLSWSRLENWTVKNALHLVDCPNKEGKTPLSLMAEHPTWRSKILRHLLGEAAGLDQGASKSPKPKNPSPPKM